MMKLPVPVHPAGAPGPGESVQVPTATPLLSVPLVVEVPFDVPVSWPFVSVKTLPVVVEVTEKFNVPVTALFDPVTKLMMEPVSVEVFSPFAKHEPALKKLKPVISSGPLLNTVNVVTKFSKLASPMPPVIWASQFPVVEVLMVEVGVVFVPQLQTKISSASSIRIASFFIYRP
jgi:hypothetical protein